MAAPIRELLHITAPIAFQVEGEGENKPIQRVIVKGFASVETGDRSGDIVPPEEFNIERFMAAPTLLLNHRFWTDPMGNRVAIGRPLTMNPVKLGKIAGDDDNWAIIDLKTKKQIDKFPKVKVPDLKAGSRGLFITAEITVPEVAGMVVRGELSAFSWKGMTLVEFRFNTKLGRVERVLLDIDLFEVSLTHVPDNPDSTLIVAKAVKEIILEKSRFESREQAVAYMNHHNLTGAVREDETRFYSRLLDPSRIDNEKLVTAKMAEGVTAIVGPLHNPGEWLFGDLPQEERERINNLYDASDTVSGADSDSVDTEGSSMSDTAQAQDAGAEVTATDAGDKETKEKAGNLGGAGGAGGAISGDDKEAKTKAGHKAVAAKSNDEAMGAFASDIATQTAAGVVSGLKPVFEAQTVALATMGTLIEKMAGGVDAGAETPSEQKPKTETETDDLAAQVAKQEAAKTANLNDVMGQLNALADGLQQTQQAVVTVAKSAAAMGAQIPNAAGSRSEKLPAEKSVEEGDDPNDCFDNTFGFLGGQ